MYGILFHVSGLAIIEILFYFYYIGPIETEIFKDVITSSIKPYVNKNTKELQPIEIRIPINATTYIILEKNSEDTFSDGFKSDVKEAEKERKEMNEELYREVIIYWCIFFMISIMISIIYLYYQYLIFIKNKENKIQKIKSVSSLSSIEMIDININNLISSTEDNLMLDIDNIKSENIEENIILSPRKRNIQEEIENTKFIDWKKIKQQVKEKSIHYIILAGFILGFEYIFFQHVILSYNVISMEEIEYLLYKMALPLIHRYVEISDNNNL
jgi:hypothetical protein